ncbi:HNH endonuclease [Brevibacterium sanguinis]|uniref:HNH endonuclease n=2 Tax=Brevibacterium TaxID=1696 RepID=A0A366IKS8_9MICO|nr:MULTISPECIES: NUMOD4 motif-containing HNH endonuclease [Brevibacterium]RBP66385.1 HNH endonuclease [Brevibacterium sanguinis]RBP73037.1 HNH endonuclease [Brevibacterium celere]
MTEEWKPIPGWEGVYEASSLGRIKSLARIVLRGGRPMKVAEKILKPSIHHTGYRRVILTRGGGRSERLVHSVIAETFHGPRPEGLEVRHRNGDKSDNSAANLAYGTSAENKQDILDHGRHPLKNRTHCPAGHELVGDNLVAWELERGHRKCRACACAHSKVHHHRELAPHFQAIADGYYQEFAGVAA